MCEADRVPLAPIGAGRTLAGIRRAPVALGISMARLARVIAHEPHDMTVVAESGITVGELNLPSPVPVSAFRSIHANPI